MEINSRKGMSHQNISSVFDSPDSIIYIMDIRTNRILNANEHARDIMRANKKAAKIFGLPAKEIIQSKCTDFPYAKNAPHSHCMKCQYFKSMQVDNYEFFKSHVHKYRYVSTVQRLKSNTHILDLPCSVKDIINQNKAERELKKANRMFQISSECNSALLEIREEKELLNEICRIIIDKGGYRLAWAGYIESYKIRKLNVVAHAGVSNKYIEVITRAFEEPGSDKSPQWLAVESGKPSIVRGINSTSGAGLWHSEAVKRGVNSLLAIPLNVEEKVSGVLNICASEADAFDTEEIELFKKLGANLSCHLNHIRLRKERETVRAEELRAGHLASLGELAAGVAHEINNPINGIINYAQMLLNTSKPDTREQDIASRIIKEGERVAVIVRNLLSFAHDRDAGKLLTNVSELLSSSMALTETQLINDGIRLTLNIPPLLPSIYAQPHNLEQVFLSIISNSRYALNQKYDGEHERKVLEIGIKVKTLHDRHFLDITFYDSGTGIPAHLIDKVVYPFFSTKPSNIGTGLGLSISHGIIRDHGGKLLIDSIEGEFTIVRIELPVPVKSEMKMN